MNDLHPMDDREITALAEELAASAEEHWHHLRAFVAEVEPELAALAATAERDWQNARAVVLDLLGDWRDRRPALAMTPLARHNLSTI